MDPALRLNERYRSAYPAPSVWSPAIDLMLQHRSIRAYRPDALPAGTLETLVAAAQSAATSSNLQTWSVVAVEDAGRRGRLASVASNQKHIQQAPLFLVWLADLSRAARLGEETAQTMEGLAFLETFLVAVVDAALAAQNATVAAESLGLGTVYIGAIRNNPEAVAAELKLPPGVMPVFGLCVGYADSDAQVAAVKPRLPQAAALHRESYDHGAERALIGEYDERLLAFQSEQGMARMGWSDLVRNRLGKIASLSGRDRLRSAILALGFELK
jgi:nitroreductase